MNLATTESHPRKSGSRRSTGSLLHPFSTPRSPQTPSPLPPSEFWPSPVRRARKQIPSSDVSIESLLLSEPEKAASREAVARADARALVGIIAQLMNEAQRLDPDVKFPQRLTEKRTRYGQNPPEKQ